MLRDIRVRASLSQEGLARQLQVSFVSLNTWERGAAAPSPAQRQKIEQLHHQGVTGRTLPQEKDAFASRGVRKKHGPTLFDNPAQVEVPLQSEPGSPILARVQHDDVFHPGGRSALTQMLKRNPKTAVSADLPPLTGMSAGKNTYTYDAHTYHTKVPPQGIAELLAHYLPEGGLVLDPFAGSGMTGVAARVRGYDCILNELSPAACFIASRFVSSIAPATFESAVRTVLDELADLRKQLYTTKCRECSRETELLYVVWSYKVICGTCNGEFVLWDHCRSYGQRVREHKILKEFNCPTCKTLIKKSRLVRTSPVPVQVGYMCCGSRQQEIMHPPDSGDLELIECISMDPPLAEGFYPTTELPDGVNLRQPKGHGLTSVDKFYTPRNLAGLSHIWRAIHRIEDPEVAAHLGFVFTSLYQRVTRLSEFRFWGGSGNTARFNVPYIYNESNVFLSFARKARTIQDHLESTAQAYEGECIVVQGSATSLNSLPDNSVDLIFTDPPFGANINYSEMNILWESWLGRFTDTTDEAIMNKTQGKDVDSYEQLMSRSLQECYRVLRPGQWMLVVFMNSSQRVWSALKNAIDKSGFHIVKADVFDKQHGTFKHFVSENTPGADLVFHCLKPGYKQSIGRSETPVELPEFLASVDLRPLTTEFLHVSREAEFDYRRLYSEWLAKALVQGGQVVDFAEFREEVSRYLRENRS